MKKNIKILYHFIFPLLIIASDIVIKLTLEEFFFANREHYTIYKNTVLLVFFIIYLGLGMKVISKRFTDSIKEKPRKIFKIFYFSINIYEILNIFFYNTALSASTGMISKDSFFFKIVNSPLALYTLYLIAILQVFGLIFYVVTDVSFLKRYIVGKNFRLALNPNYDFEIIEKKLIDLFSRESILIDRQTNLNRVADILELDEQLLRLFFNEHLKISFNDYLNRLKIEKFKKLILSEKSTIYNIEGLAS